MTVRKGTKVHPASFEIVLKLKDRWGFTYEDLSDLLDVTPSRVQQIVLHQRKRGLDDVDSRSSKPNKQKSGAQLLPDLFPALANDGVRFRRGQVTMIAGQPNSGKSLLALFYAVKSDVPTLYVSADTDAYTTAIRASAVITGNQVSSVEESFNSGNGYEFYQGELESLKNLQFSFDPSPTLDDIYLSIQAYGEAFGEYPHLIIIDNLMNVAALHDNEWTGMRDIAKAMHHVARQTEAKQYFCCTIHPRVRVDQSYHHHASLFKVRSVSYLR